MHFASITLLPVCSNEKISHSIKKMAESGIDNFFGYDAP